jgi:drug/metabolite transporter superfamily protein YnfA
VSPGLVVARVASSIGLVVGALYYLQFAIQAIANAPLQSALALVGVAALAAGAYRILRHQSAALLVLLGTLPLLVFHVAATFMIPDESPIYIAMFGVVPAVSLVVWLARRGSSRRSHE